MNLFFLLLLPPQNVESFRGIFDSLFIDGADIGADEMYGDDMDGDAGWGGDDIDFAGGGDEDAFGDVDGEIGGDDDDGTVIMSQTCAFMQLG